MKRVMLAIFISIFSVLILGCGVVKIESLGIAAITDDITTGGTVLAVETHHVDLIPTSINDTTGVVTYDNVPAGRIHSFKFFNESEFVSALTCTSLPSNAIITNSVLHIDLGLQSTNGTLSITCSTGTKNFILVLNYLKATVALVSSSTNVSDDGWVGASYNPSAASADTASNRWIVWEDQNASLGGFTQIIAQNTRTSRTVLVSAKADGTIGDEASYNPSISSDGRYVVFDSFATNFVTGLSVGSTNNNLVSGYINAGSTHSKSLYRQVYVKDLTDPLAEPLLVSTVNGLVAGAADGDSKQPKISADGRYIVFESVATNLTTNAPQSAGVTYVQVYRKDRLNLTAAPVIVSSSDPTQANQATYAGNDDSYKPVISSDGSKVSFVSEATNLIPGKTIPGYTFNNGYMYYKNLSTLTSAIEIISSTDSTLANQTAGGLVLNDSIGGPYASWISMSADGTSFAFSSGSSGSYQTYLKRISLLAQTPAIISSTDMTSVGQSTVGTSGGSLSPDGLLATFNTSQATFNSGTVPNGCQIFLKNIATPGSTPAIVTSLDGSSTLTQLATTTFLNSITSRFSTDSSMITFTASASNFLSGNSLGGSGGSGGGVQSVFTKSAASLSSAPSVISAGKNTAQYFIPHTGNNSWNSLLSDDGAYITFNSQLSNVKPGITTNGFSQIYLRSIQSPTTAPILISSLNGTAAADGLAKPCDISSDGRFVLFVSDATNLESGTSVAGYKIFVKDRNNPTVAPTIVNSLDSTQVNQTGYTVAVDAMYASHCEHAKITGDGRYVAFLSNSTTFATGALISNASYRILLKDIQNPQTAPVAVSIGPFPGITTINWCATPALTPDGHYLTAICFLKSSTTGTDHYAVVRKDLTNLASNMEVVSSLDSSSVTQTPATGLTNSVFLAHDISDDGRFVVFNTDFVFHSGTGVTGSQIYIKDMSAPTVRPVIVSSLDSTQADQTAQIDTAVSFSTRNVRISGDGRYILFSKPSGVLTPGYTGLPQTMYYLKDRLNLNVAPRIMNRNISTDTVSNYDYFGTTTAEISYDGSLVLFMALGYRHPGILRSPARHSLQTFIKRWADD